jgi:hypothetical protein
MAESARTIVILRTPADDLATSGPVGWALEQLRQALNARGVQTDVVEQLRGAPPDGMGIVVAGPDASVAGELLERAGVSVPRSPEALAVVPGELAGRTVLLATGSDVRGVVYALLELADIVACAADPFDALRAHQTVVDQPANPIRGVARLFVSEVEDKPWFYDRESWCRYLSMLVAQRFNRIHLALGMGVNFLRNITDAYLLFPYPFLVAVPGYQVRALGLADEERERNLQTLRFISDEAAARGLHFQLGVWTQGYAWIDSPNATYTIEGLTPDNHAAYCRDALASLLEACPRIAGVTFRVHGESGVPEGSYDFWRTVFRGAMECGRRVELDLHPKGVDREMIQVALDTGLPVNLSPKYTAEHMGLPGHQVEIRSLEREPSFREGDSLVRSLMNKSGGALRYTRYGYADFLTEDREYGVFYRIWPGTQRLLLWGDPALAAGFGRHGSFCGCLGVEICEPLSFKGRFGSGLPGGRNAYADDTLRPTEGDWAKYLYTYRLFGRLLYNPDANPASWRRYLAHEFGAAAAGPVEAALASASRVLPLVTTAHDTSADNISYWPEMYSNMPIVNESRPHPYRDTPTPKRFGTVSPLDPALFSRVEDFADEVVRGECSAKYSPLRVAGWLDDLADTARQQLSQARETVAYPGAPEFRRLAADVAVQAQVGRFFASKLRAGVAYALWKRTAEPLRLREALQHYGLARAAWAEAAEHGRVYRDDITVGREAWQRGHWADRLAGIDADLADMEAEYRRVRESPSAPQSAATVPLAELEEETPPPLNFTHVPPVGFAPGQPVRVELGMQPALEGVSTSVQLHYRHVNQAEAFCVVAMSGGDGAYSATIPSDYTQSSYPLQYYFELRRGPRQAWLSPGLSEDLASQAYVVIRQSAGARATARR